jgi:undecaprenyl-diphosphatase
MDTIFIFGAKYLFLLSGALFGIYFLRASREEKKRMIIFSLFAFPLALILALAASYLYFNPRPFVTGGFIPLIPHAADNGFPSDHVLLVAAVAGVMSFFNRRWAIILWVIAGLVAISRIYVGVHHSLDVVASIALALLSAILVHITYGRK